MAKIMTDSKVGNDLILTNKKLIDQGPLAFRYHEFPLSIIYKGDNEVGEADPYDKFNGPENYTMFRFNTDYGVELLHRNIDGSYVHDHRNSSAMSKIELSENSGTDPVLFGYMVLPFNFRLQGFYFYADKIRWDRPDDVEGWGENFKIDEYRLYKNNDAPNVTVYDNNIEEPATAHGSWYQNLLIEINCESEPVGYTDFLSGDLLKLTFLASKDYARFSGVSMGVWGVKI
jgi:hypothetical protein